jgi:hypothetical protein
MRGVVISFFACLSGFVNCMDVNTVYKLLQDLELKKVQECSCPTVIDDFVAPLTRFPKCISSLFNEYVYIDDFDEKCAHRPVLDFSEFSFKEIMASFIEILQSKLNSRGKEYITRYAEFQDVDDSDDEDTLNPWRKHLKGQPIGELRIDPYYTKILMNGRYYNFSLCYDGNSKQPGNCVLRESPNAQYRLPRHYEPTWKSSRPRTHYTTKEWRNVPKGSDLEKLLFAVEIARRNVVDDSKKDDYVDLPVWCAIAIRKHLEKRGITELPDWSSCFSGRYGSRERTINSLIERYISVDDIAGNVETLMDNM